MMHKTLQAVTLGAGLALTSVAAHAAPFVSTLEFFGAGIFDADRNLTLTDIENAIGNGLDVSNDSAVFTPLDNDLGTTGFSLGVALFAAGGNLDLPDVDADMLWTVELSVGVDANFTPVGGGPIPFGTTIDETLDINAEFGIPPFSINDAAFFLEGITFTDEGELISAVLGALAANQYTLFDGVTALLLSNSIANNPAAVILTQSSDPLGDTADFLGFDIPAIASAQGAFKGSLTLTATPVSEPATLALLGLGLAGLAIGRRRRS